jgi:gamma-glutamyltranspeptidase / glutathione hydrolase
VTLARKPLYAPSGVVATSQPLAASAGLAVLRRGGNAVDAAVATAITLSVVQPGSNDIGGDLFATVWDGTALHGLNASGRSPAALTLDRVRAGVPERGWLPVTVPGAPAGWRDLHARFGALPFAELFTDALRYAEDGYPVSPMVALAWQRSAELHTTLRGPEFAEWARVFTRDGRAPRAGERFRNPGAARTLRLIAASGAEDFYRGETAAATAGYAARTGGLLTMADLAAHCSTWVAPVRVGYRGYDVWELPPNGQGVAALLALGILDGLDVSTATAEQRRHWQVEAVKLGFADAHAYVADPDLAPVPVEELLNPAYVQTRRALVGATAALPEAGEPSRGGTVYLCTADAGGMMVSLIQSTYLGFGSHVTVPGYGFGLQNRGAGFSVRPGHPNVVAGGKRPYHTIIPGFLTRAGQPVGPFGVMGGHMQPQGHVQLVTSTVDSGLDPQAALDAPRWRWQTGRRLSVEPHLGEAAVDALRRRGHEVTVDAAAGYGYGQAIWRTPDGGYVAGTEPRADGCALGY